MAPNSKITYRRVQQHPQHDADELSEGRHVAREEGGEASERVHAVTLEEMKDYLEGWGIK